MSDSKQTKRPRRTFTCTCGGRTLPGKGLCARCLERECGLDKRLQEKLERQAPANLTHDEKMRLARKAVDDARDELIRSLYPAKHTKPLPFGGEETTR